jgi:AraC-like DNA-binding protein
MAVPLKSMATHAEDERLSIYREFAPSPDVWAVVACTWTGHAGWRRSMRVLPDGCVDIVWNGQALLVVAARPHAERYALEAEGPSIGLRLRCGTAGAVLGTPADELPPEPIALRELWPTVAVSLHRAAGEAEVRRALEELVGAAGAEIDGAVMAACRLIVQGDERVGEIAAAVGLGPRDLHRRFRQQVGFGPKALQRVTRFRRFVGGLGALSGSEVPLALAALDAGYADQAHLSRECRALCGSTPSVLAARLAA